jgi:hypothetical protein
MPRNPMRAQPYEERPVFHPNSTNPVTPIRAMTECAQCGEHLFAPEWAEYLDGGRVRHLWQCEACEYAFESTISFGVVPA